MSARARLHVWYDTLSSFHIFLSTLGMYRSGCWGSRLRNRRSCGINIYAPKAYVKWGAYASACTYFTRKLCISWVVFTHRWHHNGTTWVLELSVSTTSEIISNCTECARNPCHSKQYNERSLSAATVATIQVGQLGPRILGAHHCAIWINFGQ